MKNIFLNLFIMLSFFCLQLNAQNLEADALKFGTNNNEGSSRSVAIGGAMSAIGGDVSNINYNPAGIGFFKSSVLSFTPSILWNKADAKFINSSFQNQKSKFNISNIGSVFSFSTKKHSIINNINIGLALSNQNNYNQKIEFRQFTANSITNNWVNEARQINGNIDGEVDYNNFSFETVGAYYSYLVNYDTSLNTYTTPINSAIKQSRILTSKGNKRDFAIAMGFNILDKFYLGGAVSLAFINYYSTTTIKEEDKYNNINSFEEFKMLSEYKNTGSGLNGKIGFIYKPIHAVRLSAAIQSQTRLRLTEEYTTDFASEFDTISYQSESSLGKFTYSLATPWRANAGLALVHKKYGFISFDYELVDYASMKFIFADDFTEIEDNMNNSIKAKYQIAHNFKLGAEAKIKKFRLRAGYNIQTSPLKSDFREANFDFSRHQFSGGIGYLFGRIALDLAYRHTLTKEYALSYDGINGISSNINKQLLTASIALKLGKK